MNNNLLNILKWAAGSDGKVDAVEPDQENRLLELLAIHKLTNRFLTRIVNEKVTVYSKEFIDKLVELEHLYFQQTQFNFKALQEIRNSLAFPCQNIMVIKGPACYALTGKREKLRKSNDVDFFIESFDEINHVLNSLNYISYKTPAKHEYANLTKKIDEHDVYLDIHRWFDIHRYPTYIKNELHIDNGKQKRLYPRSSGKIAYNDLIQHAVKGMTVETCTFLFPNPSMAALIICINIFKDYWHNCFATNGLVALGFLAELADYVSHDQFNKEEFLFLVKQYDAMDSARFAFWIYEQVFEKNLFIEVNNLSMLDFPMNIKGIWLSLPKFDHLFMRNENDVYTIIGKNEVSIEEGSQIIIFNSIDTIDNTHHFLMSSSRGERTPLQISLVWKDDNIVIFITILTKRLDNRILINVLGGKQIVLQKINGNFVASGIRHHQTPVLCSETFAEGFKLEIKTKASILTENDNKCTEIPLVFNIIDKDDIEDISIVIPVLLTREGIVEN